MTSLAQQQQALLDALFAWPRDVTMITIADYVDCTRARGLKSYQTNGHMLAERALLAACPVLAQLLGADSFAALSRAFWHAYPPSRGDLAQWGGDLAGFISASGQLAQEPYLADVARVEWALHICSGCADHAPEPATFQLLTVHDPATLRLVLAPGCAVLQSAWPVASIVTAHLQSQPDFGEVAEKLRAGVAETAVVWRAGYQPQVRQALPGEADLLAALQDNCSLDDAVRRANKKAKQRANALDFNAWLPMAAQTGLLLAAELIETRAAS